MPIFQKMIDNPMLERSKDSYIGKNLNVHRYVSKTQNCMKAIFFFLVIENETN